MSVLYFSYQLYYYKLRGPLHRQYYISLGVEGLMHESFDQTTETKKLPPISLRNHKTVKEQQQKE